MRLIDTVKLVEVSYNGYGTPEVTKATDVKSLFIQRVGALHTDNSDVIMSDAAVYLDPTNASVADNAFRLEGMYIIASPFGQNQKESWYKISNVNVGQRKLLNNAIDNIYCRLEKVAGLNVHIS